MSIHTLRLRLTLHSSLALALGALALPAAAQNAKPAKGAAQADAAETDDIVVCPARWSAIFPPKTS